MKASEDPYFSGVLARFLLTNAFVGSIIQIKKSAFTDPLVIPCKGEPLCISFPLMSNSVAPFYRST